MPGRILPYSAADTETAAAWAPYISARLEPVAADPAASAADFDAVARAEIDRVQRLARLSVGAAALLAEIFDLPAVETLAECA